MKRHIPKEQTEKLEQWSDILEDKAEKVSLLLGRIAGFSSLNKEEHIKIVFELIEKARKEVRSLDHIWREIDSSLEDSAYLMEHKNFEC